MKFIFNSVTYRIWPLISFRKSGYNHNVNFLHVSTAMLCSLYIKESIFVARIRIILINSQKLILINEYFKREQLVICKSTWGTSRECTYSSCFEKKGMAQQREIQSTVYTLSVAMSMITEPRCGLKTYLRNSHALEMEIFHALCFSESPDNITPRRGALRLKPVYQEGKLHCQQHLAALYIWIISLWCNTKAA